MHAHDGFMVVDGAQSVPHLPVDVRKLGADFFAFSGSSPSSCAITSSMVSPLTNVPFSTLLSHEARYPSGVVAFLPSFSTMVVPNVSQVSNQFA